MDQDEETLHAGCSSSCSWIRLQQYSRLHPGQGSKRLTAEQENRDGSTDKPCWKRGMQAAAVLTLASRSRRLRASLALRRFHVTKCHFAYYEHQHLTAAYLRQSSCIRVPDRHIAKGQKINNKTACGVEPRSG
jgi:hypothetical protein